MKINTAGLMMAVIAACLILNPETARAIRPNEQLRIDMLIEAVDRDSTLIFIRNGSEHTAQEAASHLRLKLRRAGSRVSTAEEFIDHLATSSSFSKKPYMVKIFEGDPKPAGPFFHQLLLEVAPPSQTSTPEE